MEEKEKKNRTAERMERIARRVARREERKIKAEKEGDRKVWFALGMFGLVGWSVAIPTLAFTALGVWLDSEWPADFSWTLSMLAVGIAIGCLNAWVWVKKESRRK